MQTFNTICMWDKYSQHRYFWNNLIFKYKFKQSITVNITEKSKAQMYLFLACVKVIFYHNAIKIHTFYTMLTSDQ